MNTTERFKTFSQLDPDVSLRLDNKGYWYVSGYWFRKEGNTYIFNGPHCIDIYDAINETFEELVNATIEIPLDAFKRKHVKWDWKTFIWKEINE